jgi:hypothetical protein
MLDPFHGSLLLAPWSVTTPELGTFGGVPCACSVALDPGACSVCSDPGACFVSSDPCAWSLRGELIAKI